MILCTLPSRLFGDARGATVLEFAFVAPVMCLLLVGGLDIGHTLYVRATLEGVVQKAARDSGLENGPAARTALDNMVRGQVRNLVNNADVTFDRRAYRSYAQAARRHEDYTDTNNNGTCDAGEPYVEENGVAGWQSNMGATGQGGAKDAVIYRVTVSYPAILPLWRFINGSDHVEVEATTVLRNQPYGDQARTTPGTGNCT